MSDNDNTITYADLREVKHDLQQIDREHVDASIWYQPTKSDGFVGTGDFSYFSVDVIPADTTNVLDDVLEKHGLVIRDVSLGQEGFGATLTFEGLVHGDEPVVYDE